MRHALALALLAGACSAQPVERAEAAQAKRWDDAGRFVVTRVLIDPAIDNAAQRYFSDDPRLKGRMVEIAPARLAIGGDYPCTQVERRRMRRSVAALLKAALPRRSPNGRAYPLPAEMKMGAVPAGAVETVAYRCTGPDEGKAGGIPGHDWSGAVAFPLGGERRGLLWASEMVLVLEPAARAAVAPSFDCARAAGASEKAICADPALAGWDRSVAAAFAMLRDGSDEVAATDDPGALVESQRRWVAARDACGADARCLEDRMAERTDALMRRQY